MSWSAKAEPPVPCTDRTTAAEVVDCAAAGAAGAVAEPAAGAVVGPVCATLTELTDASTPWAAVTLMPALVRLPTKLRRDICLFRYLTTSSRILVSLGYVSFVEISARSFGRSGHSLRGFRRFGVRPEIGAEIIGHHF